MDELNDLVFPLGRTVDQVREEAWDIASDESQLLSYKEALDAAAKRHGVFGRWESAVALLESKQRLLLGQPEQKKHLEITVEDLNRLDLVKVWREDQDGKSRYFVRLPAVVRKNRQQKAG